MINPRKILMGVLPVVILVLGGLVSKALIDSYEEPTPEPLVVEPPLVHVIPAELESLTLRGVGGRFASSLSKSHPLPGEPETPLPNDPNPAVIGRGVFVAHLAIEVHLVAESGATAGADGDAERQ